MNNVGECIVLYALFKGFLSLLGQNSIVHKSHYANTLHIINAKTRMTWFGAHFNGWQYFVPLLSLINYFFYLEGIAYNWKKMKRKTFVAFEMNHSEIFLSFYVSSFCKDILMFYSFYNLALKIKKVRST